MAKPSDFSATLMAQFATAFAKEKGEPAHLDLLCQNKDLLRAIPLLLNGNAEIDVLHHFIDCDAAPFVPEGWRVITHKKGGVLEWGEGKFNLRHAPGQTETRGVQSSEVRKDLVRLPVQNANVLDYLLGNPKIIPDNWKRFTICFWGTIYHTLSVGQCIRCLEWDGEKWEWVGYGLDVEFEWNEPALVLAGSYA